MIHVDIVGNDSACAERWRKHFSDIGTDEVAVNLRDLEAIAESSVDAVLIDASHPALAGDLDELLTHAAHVAARRIPVAVDASTRDKPLEGGDLHCIAQVCRGLLARGESDCEWVGQGLMRAAESRRRIAVEFATVAPAGVRAEAGVLVVLTSGKSLLVDRPLIAEDSGEAITELEVLADGSGLRVHLDGNRRFTVPVEVLRTRAAVAQNGEAHHPSGAQLGARLRELRLRVGLTQAELAKRTGIHRPNIARVEAGRHTPSIETLDRLASAMGLSVSTVLASA